MATGLHVSPFLQQVPPQRATGQGGVGIVDVGVVDEVDVVDVDVVEDEERSMSHNHSGSYLERSMRSSSH